MLHCLYIERQIVQNILHMLSHAFVLSAQAEGNERRKDIQSKNQRTQPEPTIKFIPLQTSPLSLGKKPSAVHSFCLAVSDFALAAHKSNDPKQHAHPNSHTNTHSRRTRTPTPRHKNRAAQIFILQYTIFLGATNVSSFDLVI